MTPSKAISIIFFTLSVGVNAIGQISAENSSRLQNVLTRFPQADANNDGVLTQDEATAFLQSRRDGNGRGAQRLKVFRPTTEDFEQVIALGNVAEREGALEYQKGNGLRVVMTGHSWVAPGRKTLPIIAAAAGWEGHRQRAHISGGGTGAANSIWLKEFGQWNENGPRAVLVPAIATGAWDVMTWGAYYLDRPEYFIQWIDFCLEHNPEMIFRLQDGWPRFDPKYKDMEDDAVRLGLVSDYRVIREELLRPFYDAVEERYPSKVRIIPAGAAVVDLIERYYSGSVPDLDCIDERSQGGSKGIYRDGGHLSRNSGAEWLVGYLYYGMLYKRSPELIEGFQPEGVPSRFDAVMREVAWSSLTSSAFSGITDLDEDGVADD